MPGFYRNAKYHNQLGTLTFLFLRIVTTSFVFLKSLKSLNSQKTKYELARYSKAATRLLVKGIKYKLTAKKLKNLKQHECNYRSMYTPDKYSAF